MLTQTLRSLERDGLMNRTVTPMVSMTVTYELTDVGHSLHMTVRLIKTWAQDHMDGVFIARDGYDRQAKIQSTHQRLWIRPLKELSACSGVQRGPSELKHVIDLWVPWPVSWPSEDKPAFQMWCEVDHGEGCGQH